MNIPNALSLFRIVLVPCFVKVFFSGHRYAYLMAAAVFVLAGLTDLLDGYIARKYKQITLLGRFLDPLADKLMVLAALICITVAKMIPGWAAGLFVLKELIQMVGTLALFRKVRDVPPANYMGKLGTTVFYATIMLVILFDLPYGLKVALLLISFAVIFAALFIYGRNALRLARIQDESNPQAKELK